MNGKSVCTGIYTLSSLHMGAGRASGAVDLPIVREAHTGLPFIPASALKGVARDQLESALGRTDARVTELFGSPPPGQGSAKEEGGDDQERGLKPGSLIFHDGLLLAYPVRTLHEPFVHITCPLVLSRFGRLLRALGHAGAESLEKDFDPPATTTRGKVVRRLVLEDRSYSDQEMRRLDAVDAISDWLSDLLPADEKMTRRRLTDNLHVVDDQTFCSLLKTAPPVMARVQLTSGKTTDKYQGPESKEPETGNLWYEETLPPEVLFGAAVTLRGNSPKDDDLDALTASLQKGAVQIGGNETVGQGVCLWSPRGGNHGQA
jgi:CRISPR-associated protein Cmr4